MSADHRMWFVSFKAWGIRDDIDAHPSWHGNSPRVTTRDGELLLGDVVTQLGQMGADHSNSLTESLTRGLSRAQPSQLLNSDHRGVNIKGFRHR